MASPYHTEEYSQVSSRLKVSLALVCVAAAILVNNGAPLLTGQGFLLPVVLAHSLVCFCILQWVKNVPWEMPSRIALSVGTDILIASYALVQLDEFGAIVFPIYLWIGVGTGIRHGVGWLIGCSVFALFCSSFMFLVSDYWQENWLLGLSLQVVVMMVSIFYRSVLGRTHARHEKLRDDASLSQQAAEAKTMFLANMSHELRTPLNGIHGIAQLLSDRLREPEEQELVDVLIRSSNSLIHIINDILDFAKIDSGHLELERRDFDMQLMLEDIISLLAVSAQEKGLELNINMTLETRYCRGDEVRLRQVLLNLLGNAIKFTERGSVSLDATTRVLEDSVLFECHITDTGIGISSSEASRIFDQFQQADEATTRKFGGTGLGLAISRRLVDLMGGDLRMDSQPGKGTRFTAIMELEPGTAPAQTEIETPKFDLHILLVEDNRVNQMVAKRLLETLGITCDIAENGALAVQQVGEGCYDAILMDLHMPEMSGREATARIRALGYQLPIIALTADVMDISYQKKEHIQFEGWLHKPCRIQDFIATFRALTDDPGRDDHEARRKA